MAQSTSSSTKKASSMAELMARGSSVQTLQKGQVIQGKIKKLTPQEILLDIGAKSDALVIEYDKQNLENLLSLLKVGDTVSASVISAESEEGFPVVSLRRTLDDLIFSRFEKEFTENNTITVTITDATKGGFFVEGKNGIKGFLPNSQIMPELRESAGNMVGSTVDVKIIEFDRERRRLIFSQKATVYVTDAKEIAELTPRSSSVKGTVTSITPYGVYVTVDVKGKLVEGFVHISEISHDRIESVGDVYSVGDAIEAQVRDIDAENRRVNLSVKSLTADKFGEVKEKYPLEAKVKGTVTETKSRGVMLVVEEGIQAIIPTSKVPTGTTYTAGDTVDAEVTGYEEKRRLLVVSPVLKAKFVGYR